MAKLNLTNQRNSPDLWSVTTVMVGIWREGRVLLPFLGFKLFDIIKFNAYGNNNIFFTISYTNMHMSLHNNKT